MSVQANYHVLRNIVLYAFLTVASLMAPVAYGGSNNRELTGCEKVQCPAANGEFALHLPNPLDCGSFCKCDWGEAIWFDCPGDLHFNADLQVCDWPGNAGCDPDLVK